MFLALPSDIFNLPIPTGQSHKAKLEGEVTGQWLPGTGGGESS